jgi:hypothetical protein
VYIVMARRKRESASKLRSGSDATEQSDKDRGEPEKKMLAVQQSSKLEGGVQSDALVENDAMQTLVDGQVDSQTKSPSVKSAMKQPRPESRSKSVHSDATGMEEGGDEAVTNSPRTSQKQSAFQPTRHAHRKIVDKPSSRSRSRRNQSPEYSVMTDETGVSEVTDTTWTEGTRRAQYSTPSPAHHLFGHKTSRRRSRNKHLLDDESSAFTGTTASTDDAPLLQGRSRGRSEDMEAYLKSHLQAASSKDVLCIQKVLNDECQRRQHELKKVFGKVSRCGL